ncbi:low affinity iron permease family protein [Mesorhizobium sp. CA8]|uniref:low affinity iron permease family protein n=1 Tax=unclassified Mesorhizobium TaxID=325217 RepID=UPI001CCC2948|nr:MULTISPECIES: low affinity iron permease family protein [unclassified Mesorhizobium]MBZ9759723.1 low affinity iron permease family protein [Mesorhizobium sp. CA8]MBZ9819699.1 low affinity iron permease family protein [Mesorhizobium sp. CA4]
MAALQFREALTKVGTLTSRPAAFLILGGYTISWFVFERETLDWHGFATLITWAMTLLIQRAEHRDTQALQAKLDELIMATDKAHNEIAEIDDKEPEEIEEMRDSGEQS